MSQRDGNVRVNRYEPERTRKHIFTQTLLVVMTLCCWCGMGMAGELNYDSYFPVNPNVQNEIVLVDNVVNESSYVQGGSLIAYDMNGVELDRVWVDFSLKTDFQGNVKDIFPDIQGDISYIRFGSETRIDGWIVQSTDDGEKNAMQQVPHELLSQIDVPHITINPYWDNQLTLVKISSAGTPELLIHPDEVVVNFDGTANNEINLISPDMTPTGSLVYAGDIGALLRNSTLPSDDVSKYWLEITNKTENNTPLGSSETLEENMIGVLSFFNPSSGGAFTPTDASNIIGFSHISIGYWWTGFALANPGETDATVKFIYFDNDGHVVGESEVFTIGPKSKKVDIARNLGAPLDGEGKFTGYAIAISDQPIYGFELFGPMNHESMGGVRAQAGLTGALIYEFDRNTPRVQGAILPYVKSDAEHWTGIGLLNLNNQFQRYVVKAEGSNGIVIDETTVDMAPGMKQALLVRDLFPDIDTTEITHVHVYGSTPDVNINSNNSQNYAPIVFALTGNESHTQLVGVTPVSTGPVEARLLGLQNLTRDSIDSLASLEQLVKEKTFESEDNDVVRINLKGVLKEIGKIDGVNIDDITLLSLDLYDSENNKVGILGDSGFTDDNQYSRNGISEWKVDPSDVPYGDSKLILRIDYNDQGVSHSVDFDLGITYRNKPEKDYDVNDIYANGGGDPAYQQSENPAYQITKDKINELAAILSTEGVLYLGGTQLTEQETYNKIVKYTDGSRDNGEMDNVVIYDFNEGFGNQLNFELTRGTPDKAWTLPNDGTGEKLMEQLKNLYGVNNR